VPSRAPRHLRDAFEPGTPWGPHRDVSERSEKADSAASGGDADRTGNASGGATGRAGDAFGGATGRAGDASGRPDRRRLAIRGSAFELGGFGIAQGLRLGSNLVLTRLLFPEAFGLIALVAIVLQGLELLSDMGLNQAVIQHRRGEEPAFVNTVWTLKVIRGVALMAVGLALAHPVALLYDEPQLRGLIVAVAFQALVAGFGSTSIYTLRRRVSVAPLAALEVGGQVAAVGVMISVASVWASVWALMAGGFANTVVQTVASHYIPVGYRNRLGWNARDRREVLAFGKWILGSTALLFVSRQLDRAFVGKVLGMGLLGVYSIAWMLAEVFSLAVSRLLDGVLYPLFGQVGRDGVPELRRAFYRSRLALDSVVLTGMGGVCVLGEWMVQLLWDERYAAAGWMFQVLLTVMVHPADRCLMALGHTRFTFYRSALRAAWVVVGIPVGWQVWGLEGLVWATALVELPVLVVFWPALARVGILRLGRELAAPVFFAAGMAAAWAVRPWLLAWAAAWTS